MGTPASLVNAMGEYQTMLDAIRDGLINKQKAGCPEDLDERRGTSNRSDIFRMRQWLALCVSTAFAGQSDPQPRDRPPGRRSEVKQTKTLAAGIDVIMADLKESMAAPPRRLTNTPMLSCSRNHNRDPRPDEPGFEWIADAQAQRACLLEPKLPSSLPLPPCAGYDAKACWFVIRTT